MVRVKELLVRVAKGFGMQIEIVRSGILPCILYSLFRLGTQSSCFLALNTYNSIVLVPGVHRRNIHINKQKNK